MQDLKWTMRRPPDETLSGLASCRRCPRLARHHLEVREQYPDYHAAPVGAWGSAQHRLLIVGLAPGLHGAARTGKAFVGDASGEFLFAAMHATGFASAADPQKARLRNARITNAVKCLPPGNAPETSETRNCAPYLSAELAAFAPGRRAAPRVLLTLGGVAHRAVCRALGVPGNDFSHGGERRLQPNLLLLASFHPSRLNVNTGRLTATMLQRIFERVRNELER